MIDDPITIFLVAEKIGFSDFFFVRRTCGDKLCGMCRLVGDVNKILTCCQCNAAFGHSYCIKKHLHFVPNRWMCRPCRVRSRKGKCPSKYVEGQDPLNIYEKMGAIGIQIGHPRVIQDDKFDASSNDVPSRKDEVLDRRIIFDEKNGQRCKRFVYKKENGKQELFGRAGDLIKEMDLGKIRKYQWPCSVTRYPCKRKTISQSIGYSCQQNMDLDSKVSNSSASMELSGKEFNSSTKSGGKGLSITSNSTSIVKKVMPQKGKSNVEYVPVISNGMKRVGENNSTSHGTFPEGESSNVKDGSNPVERINYEKKRRIGVPLAKVLDNRGRIVTLKSPGICVPVQTDGTQNEKSVHVPLPAKRHKIQKEKEKASGSRICVPVQTDGTRNEKIIHASLPDKRLKIQKMKEKASESGICVPDQIDGIQNEKSIHATLPAKSIKIQKEKEKASTDNSSHASINDSGNILCTHSLCMDSDNQRVTTPPITSDYLKEKQEYVILKEEIPNTSMMDKKLLAREDVLDLEKKMMQVKKSLNSQCLDEPQFSSICGRFSSEELENVCKDIDTEVAISYTKVVVKGKNVPLSITDEVNELNSNAIDTADSCENLSLCIDNRKNPLESSLLEENPRFDLNENITRPSIQASVPMLEVSPFVRSNVLDKCKSLGIIHDHPSVVDSMVGRNFDLNESINDPFFVSPTSSTTEAGYVEYVGKKNRCFTPVGKNTRTCDFDLNESVSSPFSEFPISTSKPTLKEGCHFIQSLNEPIQILPDSSQPQFVGNLHGSFLMNCNSKDTEMIQILDSCAVSPEIIDSKDDFGISKFLQLKKKRLVPGSGNRISSENASVKGSSEMSQSSQLLDLCLKVMQHNINGCYCFELL